MLQHLHHIEHIVACLRSVGHQRFHQETVAFKVSVFDYGVVAVSSVYFIVTMPSYISELVREGQVVVFGHLFSLICSVGLKFKSRRIQCIERCEIRDVTHITLVHYVRVDHTRCIREEEMLHLSLTEADMHFVGSKVLVENFGDLGDIVFYHRSEAVQIYLFLELMDLVNLGVGLVLRLITKPNVDQLLGVQVPVVVACGANRCW